MSPWINYHHLYYFKTIAEEGSVSKAAERLRLGQPTLSAQLKQFEDTMGVQLFERHHKRLVLTEQGKVALDYAKSIFKMGSEMYDAIHDRLKPARPSLQIGAIDSIPKQMILRLVKHALRISPCQITLTEGRHDELLRELAAHRIDLLLTSFLPAGADAKGLLPRSLAKNGLAIFGAPKFKPLRKGFPQSIAGQPLVVPTYDSRVRQDLDHWAKLHDLELNIVIESQDIGVKKLLASEGLGLIVASAHSVQRQVLQGELVEIGKMQGTSEEVYMITAQRKIENPIAARLAVEFNA